MDTCNFIYRQRLGKCIQDAFQTFFIPELATAYSGLELIQEQMPFSRRYLETSEQEQQLSVALG